MITGVHHFAIIVSLEENVWFYTKHRFCEAYRKSRKYDTVVLLDVHGMQIEMLADPNHSKRATNPKNTGVRHLALKVEEIEETVAELGLEIGPIIINWIGIRL